MMNMKSKSLFAKWIWAICFALFAQASAAQTTCYDFATGLGNWGGFDAQATLATDNTPSNGTQFMRGRDQGGTSWLRNSNDFNGMPCGGQICWRFKVINDDVSGQSISVNPKVTIYMGPVGNMTLSATFTASNITVTENSAWVDVCAPIAKVSPLGAMPAGWAMRNGGTVAQWNHLVNNINGIAFTTDINPANDPGEIIGIDDVCVTANPANSCCDLTDNAEFIIETVCVNGALRVTVTDPDPDPVYHWWRLMETSVPGETTDAVTLNGGNPVAPEQTLGGSATFVITDFSKSYYIKHDIMGDLFNGCFYFKQVRKPIEMPQADFDFSFLNWLNWSKTEFCYGERINLFAWTETQITKYYIDAWRRPIGSPANTPFTWYGGLGWANGAPGSFDLTAAFAALPTPVYFDPGYEYEIKLAVANPDLCIGWSEKKHRFTVTCCNNAYLDADFCVDAITAAGSYTLKVKNYITYNHIGAVHEWYVLSSPNENAGPYTKVTSVTTSEPTFDLYTQAQYNLYYTVVHKLKTKCGEICMVKTQHQTGGRGTADFIPGLSGCDAKLIDCKWIDSIWNPCPVPTGLFGSCSRQVLVWNPVPGALGYTVEISFNDPACCQSPYPVALQSYNVNGSGLPLWTIATPKYNCFRWRVRARCANGQSAWSVWKCFHCSGEAEQVGHDGESGNALTGGQTPKRNIAATETLQPRIVPNPSNGDMTLSMEAPGDLVLSVEVYNAQGSRIKTIARNTYRGGQFVQKLNLGHAAGKGIYTVVFLTNYGTYRKKVVVQ
jgi:hypothetical protein